MYVAETLFKKTLTKSFFRVRIGLHNFIRVTVFKYEYAKVKDFLYSGNKKTQTNEKNITQ